MIGELGRRAFALASALSLAQVALRFAGTVRDDPRLTDVG
jgi:hypothetical protein